jgi:hypothetical protein
VSGVENVGRGNDIYGWCATNTPGRLALEWQETRLKIFLTCLLADLQLALYGHLQNTEGDVER